MSEGIKQETTQDSTTTAESTVTTSEKVGEAKTDTPPEIKQAEKSYSQKQYDDMAVKQYNTGLINAMKEAGFTDVDEKNFKKSLTTFKKWLDDQKTAEQLQAEKLTEAQRIATEAQSKLTKLQRFEIVRKANVSESFVKFVSSEVSDLSKEKDISFDDALEDFLKVNADTYKKQGIKSEDNVRNVTVDTGAKEAETKETKNKMPKFW